MSNNEVGDNLFHVSYLRIQYINQQISYEIKKDNYDTEILHNTMMNKYPCRLRRDNPLLYCSVANALLVTIIVIYIVVAVCTLQKYDENSRNFAVSFYANENQELLKYMNNSGLVFSDPQIYKALYNTTDNTGRVILNEVVILTAMYDMIPAQLHDLNYVREVLLVAQQGGVLNSLKKKCKTRDDWNKYKEAIFKEERQNNNPLFAVLFCSGIIVIGMSVFLMGTVTLDYCYLLKRSTHVGSETPI
jgi:hypothetical protein